MMTIILTAFKEKLLRKELYTVSISTGGIEKFSRKQG